MSKVITGLERLKTDDSWQKAIKGNIAYLCHSASIDKSYQLGVGILQKIYSKRLKKLMGPQHGLVCDVQDNMIETQDFIHPYYQLPVHSLYGHTRSPTDEMLQGIDTVLVDLQDVGTRIYTYISTMTLLMEACGKKGIKVVVLDRPNPIGGSIIEGNILNPAFSSFVGRHAIPTRHGLTMGEVAHYCQKYEKIDCQLEVISMLDWKREMFFEDTGLPWVYPSPNLPTADSTLPFVGTVLFEGTNISEGRGTTRSLEIVGHPAIGPFSLLDIINVKLNHTPLEGFILRPLFFMPTFQKHKDKSCGGFQIQVSDKNKIRPWALCQLLCQIFFNELGDAFEWKNPPYEYEYHRLPIDLINGSDELRLWVEAEGSYDDLIKIETRGHMLYKERSQDILLY